MPYGAPFLTILSFLQHSILNQHPNHNLRKSTMSNFINDMIRKASQNDERLAMYGIGRTETQSEQPENPVGLDGGYVEGPVEPPSPNVAMRAFLNEAQREKNSRISADVSFLESEKRKGRFGNAS